MSVIKSLTAVLFLLVSTEAFLSSRNSCNLRLYRRTRHPTYKHVRTVPEQCTSGHVDWHYPRGLISLDFSREGVTSPFTICISSILARAIKSVADVTDEDDVKTVEWSTQDDANTCVTSHGSRMRLELDGGPRMQYYMTRVAYTREDLEADLGVEVELHHQQDFNA